jgi:sugar lactone lactonase YvrE
MLVDIHGKAVHRYVPSTGATASWSVPEMVGTIVPREGGRGYAVALVNSVQAFEPVDEHKATLNKLCDVHAVVSNRLNE